ncbi:MAG: hypothetical protein NPIRA05_04370 [Nitrospirales bacterium]|nr:MAG: hypothetical protein NPIRA05_04370 [Nitrospirales bacterium]
MADSRISLSEPSLALLEALIDDMFRTMLTFESNTFDHGLKQYDEVFQQAREYMYEHFNEPLSIPDVAEAISASTRTLQIAFKNRCGWSPLQYLNDIRIEELRKILLKPEPDTTVTSAATNTGLFHLGRLGKIYDDRYGELPSATLRRSRVNRYQ